MAFLLECDDEVEDEERSMALRRVSRCMRPGELKAALSPCTRRGAEAMMLKANAADVAVIFMVRVPYSLNRFEEEQEYA